MNTLPSAHQHHLPSKSRKRTPLRRPPTIPIQEFSAGGIVFRAAGNNQYEFILIQDGYGKWTFPKGRIEPGESAEAAALAEVEEEAGIREPNIIGKLGEVILTLHPKNAPIHKKKVYFFLIKTKYSTVEKEYQKPSVLDARWFPMNEVPNMLGYTNMKTLYLRAIEMIKRIE